MLYKKFRLCAQVVGCITIGLLAVYGLVAVLGGGDLVAWASGRAAPAAGSVPSVMNYQGHLKDDSGVPLDGTYTMTFRIYDSVDAPTALWEETHTGVTVREGYFNVLLGYSNPLPDTLFSAPARYIGVTVAPHEEMTPRQRFASVPYAFHAWQADRADRAFGLSASDGDPADVVVVDGEGKVGIGIGTMIPQGSLHVNGDYYGRGHISLYAYEGDGASGTAYVQARDTSGSSNIDLQFRTKEAAVVRDVMRLKSDGNVEVSGDLGVDGQYYGEGNVHLYAVEGAGESGTAYIDAWDQTATSNIGLTFRTKEAEVVRDVMRLTSDGNVEVSGDLTVSGAFTNTNLNVDYYWHRPHGDVDESIIMTSQANSICFLTDVSLGLQTYPAEEAEETCKVEQKEDGYWWLHVISKGYSDMRCEARCLSW